MQVHLSSSKYDIIASGEAFVFEPCEDLTIQIDEDNETLVRIVLKFVENASGKHDIEADIIDDSMVITCINFSTGLKCPTHIANVNGKEVYFMFSSGYQGDVKNTTRSVKYTVFMEK